LFDRSIRRAGIVSGYQQKKVQRRERREGVANKKSTQGREKRGRVKQGKYTEEEERRGLVNKKRK
jgi:hypothetical protein